jgi:hypothetical protein
MNQPEARTFTFLGSEAVGSVSDVRQRRRDVMLIPRVYPASVTCSEERGPQSSLNLGGGGGGGKTERGKTQKKNQPPVLRPNKKKS